MKITSRWFLRLLFPAIAAWGLVLVSCVMVNRTVIAPPRVAGATFVGQSECTTCHSEQTSHFASATHSRLGLTDGKAGEVGCEACHGPASLHTQSGGARGTIINPRRSPE